MSADPLQIIHDLHKKPKHWGWVGDMYLAGNDDGVAMRLHDGQEYEPESRKLWRTLCKDARVVIDVGAHTGRYSLDAWKAGAKSVISIEPYYLNIARMVMNLRHAGYEAGGCICCAAGEENGTTKFAVRGLHYYCSAGGAIGPWREDAGVFPVLLRRVDTIIKKEFHEVVDVVKIDTERHGYQVLQGMPIILSYKPDLILECIEPGMGDILKPLGYRFYTIHEKTGLHPVDDLIPDDPFTFDSPNRYATAK